MKDCEYDHMLIISNKDEVKTVKYKSRIKIKEKLNSCFLEIFIIDKYIFI